MVRKIKSKYPRSCPVTEVEVINYIREFDRLNGLRGGSVYIIGEKEIRI